MFGRGVENLRRGSAAPFGELLKYLECIVLRAWLLFHFPLLGLYLWVLKWLLIFQGFWNVKASSYSRLKSSDEINGKIRGIVNTAQFGNLLSILLVPSKWSSFLFLIFSYGLVLSSGSCESRCIARRCTETRKYWAAVLVPALQNLMQVTSLWMVTS